MGQALVIDCRDLAEGDAITMDRVRRYGTLAEEADFLLLTWDGISAGEQRRILEIYPCVDDEVLDHIIQGHL